MKNDLLEMLNKMYETGNIDDAADVDSVIYDPEQGYVYTDYDTLYGKLADSKRGAFGVYPYNEFANVRNELGIPPETALQDYISFIRKESPVNRLHSAGLRADEDDIDVAGNIVSDYIKMRPELFITSAGGEMSIFKKLLGDTLNSLKKSKIPLLQYESPGNAVAALRGVIKEDTARAFKDKYPDMDLSRLETIMHRLSPSDYIDVANENYIGDYDTLINKMKEYHTKKRGYMDELKKVTDETKDKTPKDNEVPSSTEIKMKYGDKVKSFIREAVMSGEITARDAAVILSHKELLDRMICDMGEATEAQIDNAPDDSASDEELESFYKSYLDKDVEKNAELDKLTDDVTAKEFASFGAPLSSARVEDAITQALLSRRF